MKKSKTHEAKALRGGKRVGEGIQRAKEYATKQGGAKKKK